jgi:nucleotide-binding universal stress UspA family protein
MFNRILVPLDGSSLAERALLHAEKIARIFGSHITLLQVLDPTSKQENPNPIDPISWQIRKTEADIYLDGIAKKLRTDLYESKTESNETETQGTAKKKNRVDYSIQEGKPAENIVNYAHAENIDLLIICTHGSGGISRWNISSVTQKVISKIFLPVLVVRTNGPGEISYAGVPYRRILLPIDISRRAECSLAAGIALARNEESTFSKEANSSPKLRENPEEAQIGTKLILAAVIKAPELPIPEPYPLEIRQLSEQLMHISRQVVNNYLNEMKERLAVDCESIMIENNSVSSAIQELAIQDTEIDLVVLCAHGYTGRSTWPYGNVARNYIEHGTKPVLIIQDLPRSKVIPIKYEMTKESLGGR